MSKSTIKHEALEDITSKLEQNNKRLQAVRQLFSSILPGEIVELQYTSENTSRKNKLMFDELKIRQGRVIQVTKDLIYVQDINRPYNRQGISWKDLLCSEGGVRIQVS